MNNNKKIIDIYYFSGTGNTLLASEAFAKQATAKGYSVNLTRIEKNFPQQIDPTHIIGLAFPVAMSTYPFIWNFIHGLPKVSGTKIFMLATMAGGSIGLVGRLRSILSKKGYLPIGAHQIRMPLNIFFILNEEKNKKLREKGIASSTLFAEKIANGTASWPRFPVFSDIAYLIYLAVISSWKCKWLQRIFRYKIDEAKCTKCGLCAQLCPIGNINLAPFAKLDLKCQYCMRCISYCPTQAIKSKFQYKDRTYKATLLPFK